MPSLIWASEAVCDVRRLIEFLEEKNPISAVKAATIIQKSAENLKHYPEIGRLMADDTGRREYFLSFGRRGYVMRYQYELDVITILRVWHSL